MPFAYYARLTRSQQAVYRKSDALIEIRLENPAALRPRVAALEAALNTEERAATERASRALVDGLTDAMGLPNVRVDVLAARPHSHWGELHGLYTRDAAGSRRSISGCARRSASVSSRSARISGPCSTRWATTWTTLGSAWRSRIHTNGFYKRESSLFHQLIPGAAGGSRCRPWKSTRSSRPPTA